MPNIRVGQVGLGAIGIDIARAIAQHPGLELLVGAVDRDVRLIGRDLGEILQVPQPAGVQVRDDRCPFSIRCDRMWLSLPRPRSCMRSFPISGHALRGGHAYRAVKS